MPAKLDRCVKQLIDEGKDEASAYAICNASINDQAPRQDFTDSLTFDTATKTAISVRDGVQNYLGIELGLQPYDKVFTIYRSPATIANCVTRLNNLPLTDEHVSLDEAPTMTCGNVVDSVLVDNFDENHNSTLAVKNSIMLDGAILDQLQNGKRELSLGYRANMKPHDRYDFEQTDIEPHHLAVVSRGRCGGMCAFIDKQGEIMEEQTNPTLEEAVAIAVALPDAIKKLSIDELQKVLPVLQSIVGIEKQAEAPEAEAETMPEGEKPEVMDEAEAPAEEMKQDEDEKAEKVAVTDTAEFKDALTKAIEAHTTVIEKAREFVDASYSFTGKTTTQIMRDALAVEHGTQKFEDAEVSVAFKLLKKTASSLKSFGDSGACPFDLLKDKEL
jgi:hypothetical protein